MLNTGYHGTSELQDLDDMITEGACDLISVGRLFISNPDLVDRWQNGIALAEWDEDTFFTAGARGLTDYSPAT